MTTPEHRINDLLFTVGSDGKAQVEKDLTSIENSLTATNGQVVQGKGAAGTPAGGVVTVQGGAGGTAVPVSGSVTATGPLTDTQLRAVAVPVSGTVTASGPLTDTELRASAVPVSGTVTASGPLTDTELRATAVPTNDTNVEDLLDGTMDGNLSNFDGSAIEALQAIQAGVASGLPVSGYELVGSNNWATIIDQLGRVCHFMHISVGAHGAIVSFNVGVEHFYVPANTSWLFSGLVIPSISSTVSAKNLVANNDYTDLYISIW